MKLEIKSQLAHLTYSYVHGICTICMSQINPPGSQLVDTLVELTLSIQITLCFISVPCFCDQPYCTPVGSLLEKK